MSNLFDVRCSRCGESGSVRRMDIKNGVCYYCREESTRCDYCGSADLLLLGTMGYLTWSRCQDCGMTSSKAA